MKLMSIITALTLLTSITAFCHEGHDHGAGQVQPTKGGVIQKAGNVYFEIVGTKEEIKVYPLQESAPKAKTLKPVPLKDVKISATYTLPRGKAQTLVFSNSSDHFSANISAGSAHRYQVDLKMESGAMKDQITYQIEPQE